MVEWTCEVHLINAVTNKRTLVVPDGSMDTTVVLQLCQVEARFIYDGVDYHGRKPTVDPIAKKLVYVCEGYPVEP